MIMSNARQNGRQPKRSLRLSRSCHMLESVHKGAFRELAHLTRSPTSQDPDNRHLQTEPIMFGDSTAGLARLPDALGGDPAQQNAAARAGTRLGFLEIQSANVQYCPAGTVARRPPRCRQPGRVLRRLRGKVRKLPLSRQYRPRCAACFVHAALLESSGVEIGCLSTVTGVAALGTIYHRLCLARMLELGGRDPYWQNLQAQGFRHYANAVTSTGRPTDPHHADLEAAASCLKAREVGWCRIGPPDGGRQGRGRSGDHCVEKLSGLVRT